MSFRFVRDGRLSATDQIHEALATREAQKRGTNTPIKKKLCSKNQPFRISPGCSESTFPHFPAERLDPSASGAPRGAGAGERATEVSHAAGGGVAGADGGGALWPGAGGRGAEPKWQTCGGAQTCGWDETQTKRNEPQTSEDRLFVFFPPLAPEKGGGYASKKGGRRGLRSCSFRGPSNHLCHGWKPGKGGNPMAVLCFPPGKLTKGHT